MSCNDDDCPRCKVDLGAWIREIADACTDKGVAHVKVNGNSLGASIELTMAPAALIPPGLLEQQPDDEERDYTYDATGDHPVDLRALRKEQEGA